ncbi:MAG: histidinol dehydrogenase, partial [Bacteroidetes bacterium]|nr:histidinol dehydrogenase [Bacteroidota bacterium]
MKVFDAFDPSRRDELIRRPALETRDITADVRQILETVRRRGDAALLEFTERFDGVRPASLAVPTSDARVDEALWEAMLLAARNIRSFHEAQREPIQHQVTSP